MKTYIIKFTTEEKKWENIFDFISENSEEILETKIQRKSKSQKQNNALHLWFEKLAEVMNEEGIDMRVLLNKDLPIRWSKDGVKDNLWRTVQKSQLGTTSTTKLTSKELDKVFTFLVDSLTLKTNGSLEIPPFPDEEVLRQSQKNIKY